MARTKDPLGLAPREIQVMNSAAYARTVVPNGHLLVPQQQTKAAERLIARGFLTKMKCPELAQLGIVIKVTKKNIETMKSVMLIARG